MTFYKSICCMLFLPILGNYVNSETIRNSPDFLVGGTEATEGEFPFFVSIEVHNTPSCGGSLLNKRWVLTAGYCATQFTSDQLTVKLGVINKKSNVKRLAVEKIIPHENYNGSLGHYDIGLLKIEPCFLYNKTIQAVILSEDEVKIDENVVIMGFGRTNIENTQETDDLHKIHDTLITNEECEEKYYHRFIPSNTSICTSGTRGRGICAGDLGVPMVDENTKKQLGIVIGAVPCSKGYPDVITTVYPFLSWIKEKIANN